MAIDLHPGYRCWSRRHTDQPPPPAVGIVRETNTPYAPLEPYCQPCIDWLDTLGSAHFLVAYLDPTRQRRPQPNPDDPAVHHLVDGSCHHADCP